MGGADTRWIEPERARPMGERDPLAPEQVERWREEGFALVDGLLPPALIEQAAADALAHLPGAVGEGHDDFGSGGRMEFPSPSDAANELTLHPRMLGAVAQLLGTPVEELRLTQSDLWPKRGREEVSTHPRDNRDQRIHVDYPNHTLLHPPPWQAPEAVEIIVYLSDVDRCGGATALVPRCGEDDPAYAWPIVATPGVGPLRWINDRTLAEAMLREEAPKIATLRAEHLYPRECSARYRVGTVLLYRHDTWHRGTPMVPGALRLVMNLTFKKSGCEWISVVHPGWAWAMYRRGQVMERLVAGASVAQRCVLGIPAPGDPYWTEQTILAFEARYAAFGLDPAPYRAALVRA